MNSHQPSFLDDIDGASRVPQTDAEWFQLGIAVTEAFTPHAPIDEEALFAGRVSILNDLVDIVFQKGCHAILFGERGVGKTSLANVVRDKIFSKTKTIKVIKRNCTSRHNFKQIWIDVLDDFEVDGERSSQYVNDTTTAYDIYKIFDSLSLNIKPVIIIDEYDRVRDQETHVAMADTIKYMADFGASATIILAGVGDSVHDLFGGHPSVHRNVRQIKVQRMNKSELSGIIEKRLPILGMQISEETINSIVDLAQGFPGYTHLLAQSAFRAASDRKSLRVTDFDLRQSLKRAVELADETIRDAYFSAVRSTKANHQYKEALLAFAVTPTNEKGYFRAADAKAPFSKIIGKPADIPHFARHLKEFQDAERGPALLREGKPKSYEYRFADPLLRPYAILRGINEGLIQASDLL